MNDVLDGGFKITTGTSDNNESAINHNAKRHYDETSSAIILVASAIANSRFRGGFTENNTMGGAFALVEKDADDTNYQLATDDGTTETSTASDIPIDTSYHVHKIICASADIKLNIDGVLKVTKTTNRPDFKLQPYFTVKARSAGAKTGNIRYLEVYSI